MAPLPDNNTPRFKVHYTNAGVSHTMNVRSNDSPFAFGLNVDDLWTAIGAIMYPTTIDLVEFSAQGSNVFNSVTSGIEGNTYGTGTPPATAPATYINFIGRSSGGRRVRLALFGCSLIFGDFRALAGENAAVSAAITSLNVAANHFVTIENIKPVWKTYANAGFNAYWQREIRP